ncbi:DUF402 domain-containing protein [Microbacterium esteraromaticum]|uniref:DUF402 domain-containing protein n=1 Tax=Microbacterium esteraromaticum TaxID=57043 RepID=UPI001A8D4D9A|nr:DUF402 domain-containing protein [Microbacterium esteraromaticum]MBN8423309.1 DUF402 domain-containing protein [Microbacterium esteraromaticum]
MRLALGTPSVSASGGTATLVARRGASWSSIARMRMPWRDALARLDSPGHDGAHADELFDRAVPSADEAAPRFEAGQEILWRYGRIIEAVRVVRDDHRGLVVWVPSGSARLQPVPVAAAHTRDIPLEKRFSVPWVIRESAWTGPGVVRVAPAGRPWSVWFFRSDDGEPAGAYVNLELPHRRVGGVGAAVYSRDLVLDLWVDAAHVGSEDIWLKDSDELDASVDQGRFTEEQADAVRTLADCAAKEFILDGGWPLNEGWERWQPPAEMDAPVGLPDLPTVAAARARSGASPLFG